MIVPRDSPSRIPRDEHGLPRGRTRLHATDSITRRIGGDVRNLLMAGSTFTLQVAHPVVGAGVAEHSAYQRDPWTRLRDIDASGRRFVWTDEDASRKEGARLRRIHRGIHGVMPDGTRYHSLDPHGYGWVHTVFLDMMIRQAELYDAPLTRDEQERLFLEWYEGALFLGLRDADLPAGLDEYQHRFAEALERVQPSNSVIDHLLGDRRGPPPPEGFPRIAAPLFPFLVRPFGLTAQWLAVAGLPAAFRARLAPEHRWTDRDEALHRRVREFVRALVPRLPLALRLLPDARATPFIIEERSAPAAAF